MRRPVSIGIVGLGDRGEALARVLLELPGADVRWLCDPDPSVRLAARRRFSLVECVAEPDELLADDEVDAVAIATPVASHATLVRSALEAGKHVLVEPPLAVSPDEADRLLVETERRGRCLMVGNSVLFQPAVRKLKELIDLGRLGDIHYLYGSNQELTALGRAESVLWALGPQEIAALLYLLEEEPVDVAAHGASYVDGPGEDVVYCYLRFRGGVGAHLHLSWLEPHTTRRMTVVGSKRMAVVDDLESERKLTVYGGAALPGRGRPRQARVRVGDVVSPRVGDEHPLTLECEHFIASIRSGRHALANPSQAASAVRVLAALERSLGRGGLPEPVGSAPPSPDNVTQLVPRARQVTAGS